MNIVNRLFVEEGLTINPDFSVWTPLWPRAYLYRAFVVQKEGCAVTERELIDHCRRSLARFKVPVAIEFRTELPRTIIGKVLRRALRDEADPVVPAGMQSSRKAM